MPGPDPIAALLGDDCVVVVIRKADVARLSRVDSVYMGTDPATGNNRYLSLVEIPPPGGGIFAVHADELVTLDELGKWLAPAAPGREEEEDPNPGPESTGDEDDALLAPEG